MRPTSRRGAFGGAPRARTRAAARRTRASAADGTTPACPSTCTTGKQRGIPPVQGRTRTWPDRPSRPWISRFPTSRRSIRHPRQRIRQPKIDRLLDAFDARRSPSKKGRPYDNAVDESTNKMLKAEFAHRESFANARELQVKPSDRVHWHNNFRIHSTLGYMSPVEFRKAGLAL